MPRLPFLLQWKVAPEGHEWLDGPLVERGTVADHPSRFLVSLRAGKDTDWRLYEPLVEETGLFRQFAGLQVTEQAIIEFAGRYGLLTHSDLVMAPGGAVAIVASRAAGTKILVRSGDLLQRWVNNIRSMKVCMALWEAARTGKKKYLSAVVKVVPRLEQIEFESALVRFSPGGSILPATDYQIKPYKPTMMATIRKRLVPLGAPGLVAVAKAPEPLIPPPSSYAGEQYPFPIALDKEHPGDLAGFGVTFPRGSIAEGDILALARALVTTEISRNLSGARPVIVPRGKLAWGELRYVAENLEQALWLQFAEAVANDKNYRECLVCGKPFEISPDVARTNRLLCSDTCKVRAYRRRKSRAGQLFDRGHTVEQIAEELGSDVEKVREWLVRRMAAASMPPEEIAKKLNTRVKWVQQVLNRKGAKE